MVQEEYSLERGLSLAIAGVAAALLALPGAAAGATFVVNSNLDSGSGTLREAITMAGDETSHPGPDLIDVNATGKIELGSALPLISTEMTLSGPGADMLEVSRGPATPAFPVFNVSQSLSGVPEVTIAGLTVTNGLASASGGVDPAAVGGGILNSADLTVRGVVLRNNFAQATGGSNSALAAGGAIHSSGPLTVLGSTITNNEAAATQSGSTGSCFCASARGAGISFSSNSLTPSLTVRNSTITGNTATASAALSSAAVSALYTRHGGTLGGVTIAGNQAFAFLFAGSAYTDGKLEIRNTIIADNQGGTNCLTDAGQEQDLHSLGHNLSDDASCTLDQTGDQPSTEPQLGMLLSNGGPTPTMAIGPGSPALDAGLGAGTDQRGEPRPSDDIYLPNATGGNGADIGAFELQVNNPDCRGREGTLAAKPGVLTRGTRRSDVVIGSAGRDRVLGRGGKDRICGRGKRDRLAGGRGRDVLVGGAGRDRLVGGPGGDLLLGGGGLDLLLGGPGRDRQRQ